jgi:hypothetical protein
MHSQRLSQFSRIAFRMLEAARRQRQGETPSAIREPGFEVRIPGDAPHLPERPGWVAEVPYRDTPTEGL